MPSHPAGGCPEEGRGDTRWFHYSRHSRWVGKCSFKSLHTQDFLFAGVRILNQVSLSLISFLAWVPQQRAPWPPSPSVPLLTCRRGAQIWGRLLTSQHHPHPPPPRSGGPGGSLRPPAAGSLCEQ